MSRRDGTGPPRRRPAGAHAAGGKFEEIVQTPQFRSVVEDYRDTCLWYMNRVLHPENDLQLEQVLTAIENHGDLAAYKRVGEIRKWLPPDFRPLYSSGLPVRG